MKSEIEELIKIKLQQNEETLFLELGNEVFPTGIGVSVEEIKKKISNSILWYRTQIDRIRDEICNSTIVSDYLKSERSQNRIEIGAAICETLLNHYNLPVASTMTVLILNEGLHTICKK